MKRKMMNVAMSVILWTSLFFIWAQNIQAQVIARVSVSSDGTEGNGDSFTPSMSADGRFVLIRSSAGNLATGGINDNVNLYVHDRDNDGDGNFDEVNETGAIETTLVVSLPSEDKGAPAAISADGRFVVFASIDDSIHYADTNKSHDIFLRELATGQTTLVSVHTDGTQGDSYSSQPSISGDGAMIAFMSGASNLVGEDSDDDGVCDIGCDKGGCDIFVRDLNRGLTTLVSVASDGTQGNRDSFDPRISGNGNFVAFDSNATNLVPTDTDSNGLIRDIFVHELATAKTVLVSVASDGTQGNGDSFVRCISTDGRFVTFMSDAYNLVEGDTNSVRDVFVHDRDSDADGVFDEAGAIKTTRISVATNGTEGNNQSFGGFSSDDGRFVVFDSEATNLVDDDTNGTNDVFVHDLLNHATSRISTSSDGTEANGESFIGPISADGFFAAFDSEAANLVEDDANGVSDAFIAVPGFLQPVQAVFNRTPRTGNRPGFSLVAQKDMVVRAFLSSEPGRSSAGINVTGELCVDGSIDSCPADNLITAQGTLFPPGTNFTEDQRRMAENSINFFITGRTANNLLTPGTHSFEVRIPGVAGGITRRFKADFQESNGFDILVVPVRLRDAAQNYIAPDDTLLGTASDFLRAAYPVDEDLVQNRIQNATQFDFPLPILRNSLERRRLASKISRIGMHAILSGTVSAEVDHIFAAGVIRNLIDGMNPINNDYGYTFRTIPGVVVTLDRKPLASPNDTPVIGSTIAHELGHQLGFGEEYCHDGDNNITLENPCPVDGIVRKNANPPPQSREEGDENGNYIVESMGAFDVREFVTDRRAIFGPPGTETRGYMGSGNDWNSWTSQVEYEFLYGTVTTQVASQTNKQVAAQQAQIAREVISISGTISKDGTVTLDPLLIANTDAVFPTPAGTTYTVEFLDDAGTALDSLSFGLTFQMEILGDEPEVIDIDETPFSVTADLPLATKSITIKQGAALLTQVTRSKNSPTVEIKTAEVKGDKVEVTWEGNDADGDILTYSLFYSSDGEDILVLTVDILDTTFTFSLSDVPAVEPGAFIRVRANDGFNFDEDMSVLLTPTVTPTPVCEPESVSVFPTRLKLKRKESGEVTVTVNGDTCDVVAGETVTATINQAGEKHISISPTSATTDASGEATFTITATKKTGNARVTFKADSAKKIITVKVRK